MVDQHRRSLAKAFIYRFCGLVVLGGISWITTKSWIETGVIAICYQLFAIVMYYGYERVWERIKWGRR